MSNSKATRVGEVLQALAYRDFEIYDDSIYIADYDGGPLADERVVSAEVEKQVERHVLGHSGSSEGGELADDWCSKCTEDLFANQFGARSDLLAVLEEFDDFKKVATKESATALLMALFRLMDEQHERAMREATSTVRAREGLTPNGQSVEKVLADWTADTDRVTDFYAEWLGARFPGIVDRAERLSAISTKLPAPESIRRYVIEASRCYIFGQYLACLALCRAAIEIAFGDFLCRNGKRLALTNLQNEGADGLSGRIRIAETLATWNLRFTLDAAKEIKYWAGKVLHEKDISSDKCKELFFKARGVLGDLYS